ncbi:hypothetical protein OPT61_g3518 [Boeremia exigua]|uniref:Uncharacterized protein n=1 Tax=Boeremia exigua TaxID=749465 RepID=A0ACC2IHK6_9PLEO|nr:hypothetical protein OPT61_g3518 [Boeremia exigua]
MKASIVAASALVASVAAFEHKNHAGFHLRRAAPEPAQDEICTVYTTVYVHALPSIVPNTTAIYEPSTPVAEITASYEASTPAAEVSTSCTEGEKASSIYTPIVISTPEASQPAYPTVPAVPEASKPAVSKPVVAEYPTVPAVPEVSKPAVPEYPAEPVVPESSKEVPQPSKPATPEYPVDTPKPAPSSSKPADTPKPAPSSSKAADKPKPTGSYSSGGRIVTNGNKWAMTYTPYAPDGNCKTEADIKSDIKQIADLGFTTIRSYSTDCGVFEYVIPACQEHGLKIIYVRQRPARRHQEQRAQGQRLHGYCR